MDDQLGQTRRSTLVAGAETAPSFRTGRSRVYAVYDDRRDCLERDSCDIYRTKCELVQPASDADVHCLPFLS